jgi:SAM-dependent methyltransferase
MMLLSQHKEKVAAFMDRNAPKRDRWIKRSRYYYKDLVRFFRFNIPENSRILEIGCGTGYLLDKLTPSHGTGIDISAKMIETARENYKNLHFHNMDAEDISLSETFDHVIISDTIGYLEDVQQHFSQLQKITNDNSRIIITYLNFIWLPILKIAELLHLKMQSQDVNWLDIDDIKNLLNLAGFETIKIGRRFLFPKFIPLLSWFFNKFIAPLPLINRLCFINYVIAKKKTAPAIGPDGKDTLSVSVVVPARNEKGNIENAVNRIPHMGKHTEIIFVEGGSSDNTREEIIRVRDQYISQRDIKFFEQEGKGKGDAVRKGFSEASGDILMILDADLTVPPEDLSKFYNALASGTGEYINGCRLVYPLEKNSMRILNMMGNRFFSIMFSWILGQKLKDTLCGTKVISRSNWEKLIAGRKYFGDFDPFGDFDLIFGASKLNLKIVEVPIRYKAREYGETNISRFKHGWLLLKMVFFAMGKIKFF